MMRVVQSYNGAIDDQAEVTRWMTALSVIYLSRLGVHSVLYVDEQGRRNLGGIVDMYSEVRALTIPDWVDRRCFAAAKFFAMENEELGVVHIDNDVLLKSKKVLDKIDALRSTCDVVVQGIERYLGAPYDLSDYTAAGYRFGIGISNTIPINAGVMCITNEALREAYYAQYFDAIMYMSKWLRGKVMSVCPDYAPEQAVIHALCVENGYKIGEITDSPTIKGCCRQVEELGYAHFWGGSKVKQIEQIKSRARELSGMDLDKNGTNVNKFVMA